MSKKEIKKTQLLEKKQGGELDSEDIKNVAGGDYDKPNTEREDLNKSLRTEYQYWDMRHTSRNEDFE